MKSISRTPMQTFTSGSEDDWDLARSFKVVRHLEWFDGPLLTVQKADDGSLWLFKWCDCDDTAHRWIVASITEEAIDKYMRKEISLLSMLDSLESYLLVDTNIEIINVWRANKLPDDYLPQADALHCEDLEID